MNNPLGEQIADEVSRAESDIVTFRSRAQSVLTVAGGLMAVLAAILTLASGGDRIEMGGLAKASAGRALTLFFAAAVMVALMFRPLEDEAPTVESLRSAVDADGTNPRMDETVALSHLTHLEALRRTNVHLANFLGLAVAFQVAGLLCLAVLALALLVPA